MVARPSHAILSIEDEGEVWAAIVAKLSSPRLSSHELFWLVRMVSDYYSWNRDVATALGSALSHRSCTPAVQAAVLEHDGLGHGLDEIKRDFIKNQPSTIVGIAAACGLRNMPRGKRNHIFKYAAKSGPHARLYYEILSGLDRSSES